MLRRISNAGGRESCVAKAQVVLYVSADDVLMEAEARRLEQHNAEDAYVLQVGPTKRLLGTDADTHASSKEASFEQSYLTFLSDWPERRVHRDGSFDELFRRRDGFSLWWTSVGAERVNQSKLPRALRTIWAVARFLNELNPDRVVFVGTDTTGVKQTLRMRCAQSGVNWVEIPDVASRAPTPSVWSRPWYGRSLLSLLLHLPKSVLRASLARLSSGRHVSSSSEADSRKVLFVSENANHARYEESRCTVWFWERLRDELASLDPKLQFRYMQRLAPDPTVRKTLGIYYPGWKSQRHLKDRAPLPESFVGARGALGEVAASIRHLNRLRDCEKSPLFRESFGFCGCDVSEIVRPFLRDAVINHLMWETRVACISSAIRAVGGVRAMVLSGEFYGRMMPYLAAAHRLGISTVGVQHGTVMPNHMVYRVPRGQITEAPIPDYFAAFNEFSAQTLCELGSYARERVWVVGSPRFEELSDSEVDRVSVRHRLHLPQNKQILLVTAQTYPWFVPAIRGVLAACKGLPVFVCIKSHPKRDALKAEDYLLVAREEGFSDVRCIDDSFYDYLHACDVVVSASSTTMLEAIILGRRAICVNFSKEEDRYPYVADGGALPGRSAAEIRDSLSKLLDPDRQSWIDERREEFLLKHVGGESARRSGQVLASHVLALC